MTAAVTAAVLVIGDEILSGRTADRNINFIAKRCTDIAIELREIRVVPDDKNEIVAALDALRARYAYVFCTGGIGPTHDDITADAVAEALGVGISENERAIALLLERIKPEDLNAARRRMARIPHGADLVENVVSKAPGFWIGNVIVMAGVPSIMQAMFESIVPKLARGAQTYSRSIAAGTLAEGAYAARLSEIATDYPQLSIGSYPNFRDGRFHNEIVVRGKDEAQIDDAADQIGEMVERLSGGGRH